MMRRMRAAVSTFVLAVALGVVPALAFQPPTGQAEFVKTAGGMN